MIHLGKFNKLTVVKTVDFGIYLSDDEETQEILMPTKYVPEGTKIGDKVNCFVYLDSMERPIATTERPFTKVDQFACLIIRQVTPFGAFADWGVSKDLFIPIREQKEPMEVGKHYCIYTYLDKFSGRIVGSSKVERFLDNTPPDYAPHQKVEVLIWRKTPLGYAVIVSHKHTGLIYKQQIYDSVRIGHFIPAWVIGVREDGKIDLSLQPLGYKNKILMVVEKLFRAMVKNGGFLPLTDKSDPVLIVETLKMSKRDFKVAEGWLYYNRLITLSGDGIRLTDPKMTEIPEHLLREELTSPSE